MSGANIERIARDLKAALRGAGAPERAAREKRYHKSSREHWGLSLPQTDARLDELDRGLDGAERLALAERLWREPVFDLRIAAARLLRSPRVPAEARLWRFIAERMSELDG